MQNIEYHPAHDTVHEGSPTVGNRHEAGINKGILGDGTVVLEETNYNSGVNGKELNDNVNGLYKNLVPLGCFGPFPSHPKINEPTRKLDRTRRLKRRRADRAGRSCSPPSNPNFEDVSWNKSASIDLNVNPQSSVPSEANETQAVDESVDDTQSQPVDEVNETIAIGNALGFQIEQQNKLIIQSIGENGDQIINQ
ncbi:hypothetical protein L1887_07398 [Cichorium endivia]|nr:hypothetical protein L1887_07398 [Cichorium endivia]